MLPMKCDKCGYKWIYKGQLIITTCPSCKRNVKTNREE